MIPDKDREKRDETGTAGVMAAMGFAVLALAFSSIFISELERTEVPPLVIAFYRMALATALLMPAALALKGREIAALAHKDLALLLLGGFFLAVHFGAWIISLKYIPISTSVVLVNSHPLFVVIASYFFLGEKPHPRGLVGTAVGLAGMMVITHDALGDVRLALMGDGLALLGALAVVGYFIVGRKARTRISLLGYVTPLYAVCSVLLLLGVVVAGDRLYPYSARQWAFFGALAVVPTILGHTVFNWAIKHVRPSAISLAFLGEPVAASILAFIFFAQRPPTATFIGGALVLAGVYLSMSSPQIAPSDA
ncbi:MAG TPA: DMT family transporter [Blastocatellia bacterium]|nr:DMT family transporter [Blastocatellia bacterium]